MLCVLAQPRNFGLIRPLAEPLREIFRVFVLRLLGFLQLSFRIRFSHYVNYVPFVVNPRQ